MENVGGETRAYFSINSESVEIIKTENKNEGVDYKKINQFLKNSGPQIIKNASEETINNLKSILAQEKSNVNHPSITNNIKKIFSNAFGIKTEFSIRKENIDLISLILREKQVLEAENLLRTVSQEIEFEEIGPTEIKTETSESEQNLAPTVNYLNDAVNSFLQEDQRSTQASWEERHSEQLAKVDSLRQQLLEGPGSESILQASPNSIYQYDSEDELYYRVKWNAAGERKITLYDTKYFTEGGGGVITVLIPKDPDGGKDKVVKLVKDEKNKDIFAAPSNSAGFEFKIAQRLYNTALAKHSFSLCVGIKAAGEDFIVMPLFDGTLKDINKDDPTMVAQKNQIIRQIIASLVEMHSTNICHRDIHAGNFLIRRKKNNIQVAITDFGVTREGAVKNDPEGIERIAKYSTPAKSLDFRVDIVNLLDLIWDIEETLSPNGVSDEFQNFYDASAEQLENTKICGPTTLQGILNKFDAYNKQGSTL